MPERAGFVVLLAALALAGCDAIEGLTGGSEPEPEPPPEITIDPPATEAAPIEVGETDPAPPPSGQVELAAYPPSPVVPVRGAPGTFADLVEQVQPGVVNIYTTQVVEVQRRGYPYNYYGYPGGAPDTRVSQSLGSGFIIDADGHILTNSHVIEGATEIHVMLHDNQEFEAKLIGVDAATDIALIQIEPGPAVELTSLPLGDSDSMRVGDWTIAVGNPFGLNSTVTAGILSATGRRDVPVGGRIRYVDFLQTDASINPGNSGGPLLNMHGEVIGINTAINPEGQGIGFAIPMNMAQTILPQLRDEGGVSRSWLGIFIAEVDEDVALAANLDREEGALVTRVVPGGPAEVGGIRPGDVILRFGDQDIDESGDLPWIASTAGVGMTVAVELARGADRQTVDVTMGEMPE